MKYYETSFVEYVQAVERYNIHPELQSTFSNFPKDIYKIENLILYGPSGVGKYSQLLRLLKNYSPSGLKYDKRITVATDKQEYIYRISDIHYEIDMALLGCNSKTLWHEVAWKAAMALNCQPNESTGFSPFYLFYGKQPEILGSHDTFTNIQFDEHWLYDLKIAKLRADSIRQSKASNYKYPMFLAGHEIFIRPDNSKNALSMLGEVFSDTGGATLVVKLQNRSKPISVHKGMVFVKKYSDAWKLLNDTNRDFHEMMNRSVSFEDIEDHVPVSANTRSKAKEIL